MFTTTLDEYGQKLYEEGREEGREVGREEGREEGRREILWAMADRGYSVAVIADMVGLEATTVEEIIAQRFDDQDGDVAASASPS